MLEACSDCPTRATVAELGPADIDVRKAELDASPGDVGPRSNSRPGVNDECRCEYERSGSPRLSSRALMSHERYQDWRCKRYSDMLERTCEYLGRSASDCSIDEIGDVNLVIVW